MPDQPTNAPQNRPHWHHADHMGEWWFRPFPPNDSRAHVPRARPAPAAPTSPDWGGGVRVTASPWTNRIVAILIGTLVSAGSFLGGRATVSLTGAPVVKPHISASTELLIRWHNGEEYLDWTPSERAEVEQAIAEDKSGNDE